MGGRLYAPNPIAGSCGRRSGCERESASCSTPPVRYAIAFRGHPGKNGLMDLSVRVKPGSRKGPLVEIDGDRATVYLRERAIDGQANAALIAVLARHFGVAKSRVEIVRGHTSRVKQVRITL